MHTHNAHLMADTNVRRIRKKLAQWWNLWNAAIQWLALCHYFETLHLDNFLALFSNTSGKVPEYYLLLDHDRTKYRSIRRYIILATDNIIKS